MDIYIKGVGVANRGAELMLCAVLEQIGRCFPEARFAVDKAFGAFESRAAYGLRTMMQLHRGIRSRLIDKLASPALREVYGLMHDSDVDVVLDASGFAYGDIWGPGPCRQVIEDSRRWKAKGAKVILLPQAFGPFQKPDVKREFANMLDCVDLVYAREEISLRHVRAVGGASSSVRRCHDFTNLVKGVAPEGVELPDRFAAIVPNQKILAKGNDGEVYIRLLVSIAECVQARDIEPVLVLHSSQGDSEIADSVQSALGSEVRRVEGLNGRQLKSILGQAELVAGSRFHSLVSALSQGVPCLATSWSHKYEELFREYRCPDYVLPIDVKREDLETKIAELSKGEKREELVRGLRERSDFFRQEAARMFAQVTELIATKK